MFVDLMNIIRSVFIRRDVVKCIIWWFIDYNWFPV